MDPATLLRKLRREDGFAVPTAILTLLAATSVVTVGVVSSISVQSGTTRDQNTKSALPQAEAGVNQAMLHFNRIQASANPCSPVTVAGPGAGGWCGPVTGGFDDGSFSYYARPLTGGELEVISTGTYNGVTRRVHANASSSSGTRPFLEASVLSQDGIHLDSNAEVRSNVATNGNIELDSNSKICGNASVGIGKALTKTSNAQHFEDPNCTIAGGAGEDELDLPSVNQGDAATVNDNARFFSQDLVSGNKGDACWNGMRASGSPGLCGARHLDIGHNTAVTLGGAKYSFCKLTMGSNSSLYVQAGAALVIYFDSPEACGYPSGTAQLQMNSNTRITPTPGTPASIALLFVGSSSRETIVNFNSNTAANESCVSNFILYAPRSDVTLNSNSTYCGALGAKELELDSNARVLQHGDASSYQLPNTPPHYELTRFVECTSSATASPSTGC